MVVHNVEVTVLATPEATVAQARSIPGAPNFGDQFTANGYAKKHPKDTDNPDIGFNLAVSRALADLAAEYAQRAANEVHGSVEVAGVEYNPPKPPNYWSFKDYLQKYVTDTQQWTYDNPLSPLTTVVNNYVS